MELTYRRGGARTLNGPALDKPYQRFTVQPQTRTIGAVLEGVDLSRPIDAELEDELRRALLDWKVVFLRDQELTPDTQLRVARIWGEPEVNPFFPMGDDAAISRMEKGAAAVGMENVWHSDHSFLANPARGAVLRALEMPPHSGDTMWADMAAAYDNLDADVKKLVDGLEAEHDWISTWGKHVSAEQMERLRPTMPAAVHPVVKIHPETGRKTLYVNEIFTTRILGLPEDEAADLLAFLAFQARIPEFQVRFRWEANSVAVWDNWAVQHYAINDYHPHRRVMERVALAGDGWTASA